MIYSMTAYCHRSFNSPQGTLTVELRSVNHRFLELSLKIADELKNFDTDIRSALSRLQRGKVECRMFWAAPSAASPLFNYDAEKLETLCTTLRHIARHVCPESPWPTLDALLLFPGISATSTASSSTDLPEQADLQQTDYSKWIFASLEASMQNMETMRAGEGEKIKSLLLQRVADCRNIIQPLSNQADILSTQYIERLQTRLKQLALELEPERFAQEAVLYALKADVKEELDRLAIHLGAVEEALAEGGIVGKRLDFLMQELNREANTLASKAVDIHVSQSALQLKLLIEQMREQIQNLV